MPLTLTERELRACAGLDLSAIDIAKRAFAAHGFRIARERGFGREIG